MSNYNPYSQKKADNKSGIILGIVGAFAIVGMIASYMYLSSTAEKIDSQTLCPVSGPQGITAILLDCTDPLNEIQRDDLWIKLNKIREHISPLEALRVYAITDLKGAKAVPVFNMCNPGSGETLNQLYQNPIIAKKKWSEQFFAPLKAAIHKLEKTKGYEISPIMESIQAVSINAFGEANCFKRLIVISDMLQNVNGLSFYQEIPEFNSFYKSQFFNSVYTEHLNGVEVIIYYPRRSFPKNKDKLIKFWQRYFAKHSAILKEPHFIDG